MGLVGTISSGQANVSSVQPLDGDLTAIAALTTTAYGRDLLTLANQAALRTAVGAASETATGVIELATEAEVVAGVDTTRAVTPAALSAAIAAAVTDSGQGVVDVGVDGATLTLQRVGNQVFWTLTGYISAGGFLANVLPVSMATAGGASAYFQFTDSGSPKLAAFEGRDLSIYVGSELGQCDGASGSFLTAATFDADPFP